MNCGHLKPRLKAGVCSVESQQQNHQKLQLSQYTCIKPQTLIAVGDQKRKFHLRFTMLDRIKRQLQKNEL